MPKKKPRNCNCYEGSLPTDSRVKPLNLNPGLFRKQLLSNRFDKDRKTPIQISKSDVPINRSSAALAALVASIWS